MRRWIVSLVAAVAALAAVVVVSPGAGAAPSDEGSYIVVLRDSVSSARAVADEHRRSHGAQIGFVYESALKGYSARISGRELGAVRSDPRVAYVEADGVATASSTQSGATWGIDRIDQRSGTNSSYTYAATGAGVTAYIIDTGINFGHNEFGTRATSGYDAVDGGTADDCNGHGTHVAGTVGGATYGVAKGVTLVAVRVLDCAGSGTWSGVIEGLDWAATAHKPGAPAVANMSLGGGASSSVDAAVQGLISDGVTVAVAAGNGNQGGKAQDACNYSPARVPDAITIGATTTSDAKTSWSNYGNCVDFFAPGSGITSAWIGSTTATNTISGTSMATPHVTGVAALYLQGSTTASPATVRDALFNATTKSVVTSSSTTNNHLLYECTDWTNGCAMAIAPGTGGGGGSGKPGKR